MKDQINIIIMKGLMRKREKGWWEELLKENWVSMREWLRQFFAGQVLLLAASCARVDQAKNNDVYVSILRMMLQRSIETIYQ